MSNPTAKSLYNALINKGYTSANIGDEETFISAMADKANRRELFDMVVNDGYDLGDYDAFEGRFTPQPTNVEQPTVEQPMAQVPEPMKSDTIQPVQPIQSPKAKLVDNPDDYFPTLAQNTRNDVARLTEEVGESLNEAKGKSARQYAEQTTEAAKGGFWKAIQNAMVNTAGAVELADAQAQTPQKIWGGGIDREAEKEINDYKAAEHALENAQRTINEADINAKNGTFVEKAKSTYVGGAARGFGQKLFDVRTWDMGVSDFKDQSAINDALDAAENGTLTESQEKLLDAKAQEMATQAYFGSYVGRGYKAGSVTAESLPFMLEMCINPASTLGKSAASRLARYAINKYGKNVARSVGQKAIRVAGRALGDVAGASAMTATTGSIRTAADAMDRMSGGVAFDTDEQGHAVFDGRYETPEDVGTAIKKAFAATTIENYSEMLGSYFAPMLGIFGKGTRNVLDKITAGRVGQFLDDVAASDFAKAISAFEESAQWSGNLGEFAEELAGGTLNAIIVGDQTFDSNSETGVFNRDNLIDTFLGVTLLGGSLSMLKTAGYGVEKYQQKRAVKRADVAAADAFGSVDEWDKIKTEVDAASNEELPVLLGNILSDPDVTDDQKTALMVYVGAKQREKGAVIGEQKRRENPDTPQEQVEVEQSFDNGAALETPQEKNDAQNMFEYQQQQMRQYFGLGEDGDVDAFLGDDPIAGLQRVAANDQEAGQVVLDYLNAKATVDGVFQRMSDDAEAKIAEADAIIASRTNRNNGLIQRVRLKNDKQAYVLSGDIVMTDDGDMVNVSKSSESLVVIDAITGKKEYTYPSNIAEVYQSVDAETERQTLREQVIDEYSQKLADDMNGTLAFAPGDNYTLVDDQGAQHNVQIVADNGDGTVAVVEVMPDGVQQEAIMAKSTIQEMSDTHNQLRLGQYLQEKKAQEIALAEQEAQAEQPEVVAEEQTPIAQSAISRIPTNEAGEQLFEQAPVQGTWAALVELNEGDTAEAVDTAQQMYNNAKKELDKAQKQKPKVGTSVAEIQSNKAEYKARVSAAQAKADYWANIVALGEQSAQPNEQTEEAATENVAAEEAAPVAEQTEVTPEVAPIAEEVVEPTAEQPLVDHQGNPIDANGQLIVDIVESVDELSDDDFNNPTRSIQLPKLPKAVDDAIGADGKPIIIKKNIFERNLIRHSDVTPEEGRLILKAALYNPNIYGQNQKERKPYNWVVVSVGGENGSNKLVLLEVNKDRERVEVVHWHFINQHGLEKLKRQAEREDGQLLILPSETSEEVGALSDPTLNQPSESKDTTTEPITQEIEQENLQEEQNEQQVDVENVEQTDVVAEQTIEETPAEEKTPAPLQLAMSNEEFDSLLASDNREQIEAYLKELDQMLVIDENSPFVGEKALREEFKQVVEQYGGKDKVPAEVMDSFNARYQPYADLQRAIYDRKYALGEKLAQLNEQQTTNDKQKESEAKTAHKQTAFNGFLANKTDLAAATAEKALSKKVKIEDKNYTIAEYVEQAVQSGTIELRTSEVPKYKGVSRRKWNQMDAAQQQAEQERIKNGGTTTEYYINDYNLGKVAYDYAQFLQTKATEQTPETASESQTQSAAEPEWLQKVPTDGRNFMVYTKVAGENSYSATDLKTGQAVGLVYASLVKRDRLQSLVEELPKVLLEGAHFQIRDTNGKIYYSSEPIAPTKGKKKAAAKLTTLKTVSGAEVKVPINLYKYVSTDKTRAYTGVYFDPEGFVVATDGHNMIAVKHDVAEADAEKFISKAGDVASTIFNWRIANPKPNTEKPTSIDFVDVEKQIGGKAGDKFVVFEIDGQEVGFPPKAIHVLADFQRAFGGKAFVGDMTAGKAIVIRSGDNYAIALQTTKYADLSQAIHIPSGIEQTTEQVEQPAAVSEQAQQPTEPTKQEPKPKRTADRKIEDYGEKIAGARKDILRNMSKNFDNATIESLVALPFAKAFVKPDLKKLVEAGVLRPDDAKYAEAIMWVYINKNKPKARKTDVWVAKRGRETRITAWAKKTFDGITRLRDFIEADEATRDELIAQYGQLGEQIKANEDIDRVRLNRLNGGALVFGDLYSPNPIEVVVAALDKLNYQAGDKITFDAPIVKVEYLGRFYNFENQDGEKVYAFSRANSIEEAIDTLVLQAKIRRGDTDIQYPTDMFSITREDPIREPSGMFTVFHINKRGSLIPETVEGREAAEKKVADYQSQGLSADLREEKKIVGYATHRIRFKNRLTDVETIFDEKFGSEGEARQALEERYDEFNDLANDYVASLSKQKREQPVPFEVTTSWNSETKAVKYVVKNTETGDVMSPQLDSRKEAEEYYKNHIEEWKAKWQEMKDARKKFVFFDDNVKPREGKDYRNGRDVTAEDLATTFGFRGIQFGNWTNDADRQAALNQAYDAFMDLADILGVSPKALSLAGELGIAFGARGGGSALAHYEPDEIVINLTKTKGAGSLAHEWWHALDNYFSRQGNIPMGFVTSNPTEAKMREEMRAAWQGVVKAVKGTEYAKRSMAQGDYWGRMLEMTARLFGEWTVYELAKTGRTNHFLSRGVTPGKFDMWRRINYAAYKWSLPEDQTPMPFEEFALLPRSLKGMPFPTKEETEQMGEAVRNLFDVVQEKVDEQGNVVLFQRGDFPEMPNTEANRRAYKLIREKLRKKGIEVHEVSEEQARQMAEAVGAEYQIVYHGSGAKFDRFDHSFMGTGEGAQAYGYGTYVTQVEGIGKTYAEQVSYKRGDNIEFLKYQLDALDGNIAREKEDLEWHIKQTTAIDKWLSEAQEEYDNFTKEADRLKTEFGEESPEYRNYIFYDYQADELAKAKRSKVDNTETIAFKRDRIATLEYDRNELAQDIANWTPPTAYLYSVDVPESNGEYLQWEKTVSKYVRKKLIESVTEGNFGFWVPDHLREASREARAEYWMKETYPDNPHSGEAVYNLLSVVMGSDRAASAYLRDNGFVGIEYPAQYQSGGRADNAKNYVIFNENDLKIIDRVELFQDSQGKIYGWAVGGEIYLTPDGLNANTAIHEYSHLWVEALRKKDSKKWAEIKSQLQATPFWQQVLDDPNYANIRENEDAVASEVLARLSGNKGAERLTAEAQRILDAGNGSLMARVESSALVQHVKRLLRNFYAWVSRNIFGVTNEATISQFSDMVVDDLLDEVVLDEEAIKDGDVQFNIEGNATLGERSDADSSNSSSEGLPSRSSERLRNGAYGNVIDGAKIKEIEESTKRLTQKINKFLNGEWNLNKVETENDAVRELGNNLGMRKSRSSNSYYGDFYEGNYLVDGNILHLRISTHPASAERMGNADADHKVSIVIRKNGEHYSRGVHNGYEEIIYEPSKISPQEAANAVINGVKSLIENGEYVDITGKADKTVYSPAPFRITPAMDKAYMDAVERGDMETAQRMVDEAAKKAGYTEKVYHGTPHFGFTKFDTQRSSGVIFTTNKRNVAANYAGDNNYASVRKVNKGYKEPKSISDIIENARSVFNQDWRLITPIERETVINKVEAEAQRVEQKMNALQTDVPTEIQDNVAWVENIIYSAADGRENGNEGDEMQRMLFDDYERFEENRNALRDWIGEHRPELTVQQQQYLNYLIGYELGDVAIDAKFSFANAFGSEVLATVDGQSFMPISDLAAITGKAANIGAYELYGNLGDNPLVVNGEGHAWFNLRFNGMRSTDDIAEWAKQNGYTSVVFKNISDYGDPSDVKVFFNPEQVKSADPVTYDDNGNVIPLSQRFNSRESDIRYRSDVDEVFDADFAELESEYQQLDKNDEQAMAEWRGKKKRVVESYLNYMTDDLALPASVFVYDHNDKGSLDEAVRLIAEVVADKLGENVEELYLPDHKKDLDEFTDAIAAFTEVGRIINSRGMYNVGRAVDNNKPLSWFGAVVHENAHHLLEGKHTEQEFADIWNEAVENEAPIVSKIQEKYADDTDAKKGEEVVAYTIGDYAGSMHTDKFVSFIKGENQISLADITSKLNKSLPLRNEIVIEVLNKLRDGNQRRKAETEVKIDRGNNEANREREAEGQDQARGERSPRRDSQATGRPRRDLNAIATAAEELAGQLHTPIRVVRDVAKITDDNRTTQARKRAAKGWYDINSDEVIVILPNAESEQDVIETVLHEAVAHRGLRNVVGNEAFDTFLDNVFHNANPETRAKIVNIASRNGWEFRLATEEYIASLAERGFDERENRGFWEMVRDFFRDMLSKAKIALGYDINNNDLRYMLWRSYQMQKSKGAMAVAEDVDMQRKLGVGNFRTRQANASGYTNEEQQIIAEAQRNSTYLKAPNGKPTNLTPKQWVQVRTKAFKRWFGDWESNPDNASKIVDANGEPLVVWHGGTFAINEFTPKWAMHFGTKEAALQRILDQNWGYGNWEIIRNADDTSGWKYTDPDAGEYEDEDYSHQSDKSFATPIEALEDAAESMFDYVAHPYYLNIRNVERVDDMQDDDGWDNAIDEAKRSGVDGLVYRNDFEDEGNDSYVAFRSEQIKSAEINSGEFDPTDPDIRFRSSFDKPAAGIARDIYNEKVRTPKTDYDAGAMTFEESITNGLVKLSQANQESAELRMNAIRAIGGNLAKLRRAMNVQRKYDKAAIDSVIRIAKMAMNSGFFNGLSHTEVNRLLTLINKAASSRDITKQARAVVDMLLQHQVREAKRVFEKMLKVRGSKVDNRGIIVQGKLDNDGQRMIATFKEAIKLSDEALQERIDKTLDEMGSDDNTVASNATIEYQGLLLAQQYLNDIRQSEIEEADIRKELREVTEKGLLAGDDYKEFVESVEDAIRENRLERIEAYSKMIAAIGEGMSYSIARAKEWREQQKQRVQEIHHDANSDLQGVPTDEHSKLSWKQRLANNGILRFVTQSLGTFEQYLRYFGGKSANGEGYLYNRFIPAFLEASDKEWKNKKAAQDELSAKLSDIMGKKMSIMDVFSMMRKMPTVSVQFWDTSSNSKREDKDKKTYELTQGNLLYIYMVNKMSDGRMKLRNMGISEQDVAEITKVIDPRFIKFADWLQDEFLVKKRNEYNEVHKRMFGASMAAIENYFPLVINSRSRNAVEKVEGQQTDDKRPSTITGSIIKRVRNSTALDLTNADAFAVVLDHVDQMERWAAFAEFNRDINALLSYKRFRNKVLNMSSARFGAGNELWKNFKDTCAIAAGVYRPKGNNTTDAFVLNIAKGATASKITFRLWTAIKQLLSLPAFFAEASVKELAKACNPVGAVDAWNWALEEVPTFAKRWQSRQAGDSRLRKTDVDWKLSQTKIMETVVRMGMTPNAFIDALSCVIGAKAVYETKYKRYLKQGYSEAKAKQKALIDASNAFNTTQQSSEGAYLSTIQEDRTVASVALTVFRNSNMAYARKVANALANLKRRLKKGYREESIAHTQKQMMRDGLSEAQALSAATRLYNRQFYKDCADVLIFGFGMNIIWELGSYLPYLIMGDDDEEKEKVVEDALMRSIAGPIEGLVGGDIVKEAIGWKLSGKSFYGYSFGSIPMMEDIQNILSKFDSNKIAAINDVVNILIAAGMGVNLQTLTDTAVAILDATEADPTTSKEAALLIMRIMQIPQSQIDEIYIDELGISAREARDVNPEALAHRYAEYKRKKATPITGVFYSDEEKEKAEKKYVKRFEKLRKERVEMLGDPVAREIIEDYEDDELNDTKSMLADLKKLRKQDATEYFRRISEFDESPEYQRYQTYKEKQDEIDDAIKAYDWRRVEQLRTALADELSKSYALQTNEDASK